MEILKLKIMLMEEYHESYVDIKIIIVSMKLLNNNKLKRNNMSLSDD